MKNFWDKIKTFFKRIWHGLTMAGRIIFGVIILGIIAVGVYAASDKKENKNNDDNKPEVAQTFEPSIGSPLPAYTPGDQTKVTSQVGGASTTEPSDTEPSNSETEKMAMVAPETGLNPTKPVPYENKSLNFAATLPAGSNIDEQNTEIRFSSASGNLQYLVSVNDVGTETLSDIQAQLSNSPTTKNINPTKFGNYDALKFSAAGYGSGMVFIANGRAYYLLGNNQYFGTFKLL